MKSEPTAAVQIGESAILKAVENLFQSHRRRLMSSANKVERSLVRK
jgi:hypothetical protein